jgi:hypothetical protein
LDVGAFFLSRPFVGGGFAVAHTHSQNGCDAFFTEGSLGAVSLFFAGLLSSFLPILFDGEPLVYIICFQAFCRLADLDLQKSIL